MRVFRRQLDWAIEHLEATGNSKQEARRLSVVYKKDLEGDDNALVARTWRDRKSLPELAQQCPVPCPHYTYASPKQRDCRPGVWECVPVAVMCTVYSLRLLTRLPYGAAAIFSPAWLQVGPKTNAMWLPRCLFPVC